MRSRIHQNVRKSRIPFGFFGLVMKTRFSERTFHSADPPELRLFERRKHFEIHCCGTFHARGVLRAGPATDCRHEYVAMA